MFVDGFAGPGRYSQGEEGSPIIALKAVIEQTRRSKPMLIFILSSLSSGGRITSLQKLVPSGQNFSAFERGVKFVVKPGNRFHGRLGSTRMVHLLLLATDVRAVGRRRARGRTLHPLRLGNRTDWPPIDGEPILKNYLGCGLCR